MCSELYSPDYQPVGFPIRREKLIYLDIAFSVYFCSKGRQRSHAKIGPCSQIGCIQSTFAMHDQNIVIVLPAVCVPSPHATPRQLSNAESHAGADSKGMLAAEASATPVSKLPLVVRLSHRAGVRRLTMLSSKALHQAWA